MWRCIGPNEVSEVEGVLVAIDVLRAFTTACTIMSFEPKSYELVKDVNTAFDRKNLDPDTLLVGEVDGTKVEGFDFGNSPVDSGLSKVAGRAVVHRSSNGTKAVSDGVHARDIFCASFNNASATFEAIRNEEDVAFCITGRGFRDGDPDLDGDEDQALADLIFDMRSGSVKDLSVYTSRVDTSNAGRDGGTNSKEDREQAKVVDSYLYALRVNNVDGQLFVKPLLL